MKFLKLNKEKNKLSKKRQLDLIDYFLETYGGKFDITIDSDGCKFNLKGSSKPIKEDSE